MKKTRKKQLVFFSKKGCALGSYAIMTISDKKKFGELTGENFEIGDIVEWTTWSEQYNDWVPQYGVLLSIENQIKANSSTHTPLYGDGVAAWASLAYPRPKKLVLCIFFDVLHSLAWFLLDCPSFNMLQHY